MSERSLSKTYARWVTATWPVTVITCGSEDLLVETCSIPGRYRVSVQLASTCHDDVIRFVNESFRPESSVPSGLSHEKGNSAYCIPPHDICMKRVLMSSKRGLKLSKTGSRYSILVGRLLHL